jgi:hypothetical protein
VRSVSKPKTNKQKSKGDLLYSYCYASHQWFTPIILTTQETEIRRMVVHSQPRQIVFCETLSQKIAITQTQKATAVV